MINCIIVDDEFRSRESLKVLLEDFCENVRVLAMCKNVEEGLDAIKQHKPHVIFLDIQMDLETGFDLLERAKPLDFEVIFTTAFSEYAIKAFKFSAIDYLLKPINVKELREAVGKVRIDVRGNSSTKLEQLAKNLKESSGKTMKLALPASDGLVFVKLEEISYCEASGNYTIVWMQDGTKYIVTRTLKDYDDLLSDQGFFRIHNSYLINLNEVRKYIKGDGGQVVMSNNITLDVSRRKKESFLTRIELKGSAMAFSVLLDFGLTEGQLELAAAIL